MVDMESEEQAKKRLGNYYIAIWNGCDPDIASAIRQFRDSWKPYSAASRRYPIHRLIHELIDPAVTAYRETLPPDYLVHMPGSTEVSFSEMAQLVGFDAAVRLQRHLLRAFIKTKDQQTKTDQRFIATHESLIELVQDCACKQPVKSSMRCINGTSRGLNDKRRHSFCRFCGSPTTLTSFSDNKSQLRGSNDVLRLSNLYCTNHQPKLPNGAWNPLYKQATRSIAQFDIELERINKQCANRSRPLMSGDTLVDQYFLYLMLGKTLQPADKAELRNLARRMVDSKLSDTKKKMLVLKRDGFNQTEIGKQILNAKQQPMTRQAVSKALASVRKEFLLGT
ncbi:LuxR family transcriptional regulator [Morganella morganii]|uniref:LuxR family transcriptional regulator n=1 Tax=Morganella morganii TaxID=582 RepID=UPI001FBACE43|nr:LuxR family transcriptional regulator [Morganella morganii]